jgi:hypothetical protein
MSILIQNNKFPPKSEPCYENKTRSKKLNLDNKCFQQL